MHTFFTLFFLEVCNNSFAFSRASPLHKLLDLLKIKTMVAMTVQQRPQSSAHDLYRPLLVFSTFSGLESS